MNAASHPVRKEIVEAIVLTTLNQGEGYQLADYLASLGGDPLAVRLRFEGWQIRAKELKIEDRTVTAADWEFTRGRAKAAANLHALLDPLIEEQVPEVGQVEITESEKVWHLRFRRPLAEAA